MNVIGEMLHRLDEAWRRRLGERGQGMVEYAMILALIALVVIIAVRVVGQQVSNDFSNVANGLNQ